MKGVLVRKGDDYIPLRKRMVIAREQMADFFVAIHAGQPRCGRQDTQKPAQAGSDSLKQGSESSFCRTEVA